MELEHTKMDNLLILIPQVESLDARDARDFKEKAIDIISNNNAQQVIISLRQIQFIDSSGLGSFLAILKNLHTSGGELKLTEMNKPIRTIFELVSMHKIFEIFNSLDDAIQSFHISKQ